MCHMETLGASIRCLIATRSMFSRVSEYLEGPCSGKTIKGAKNSNNNKKPYQVFYIKNFSLINLNSLQCPFRENADRGQGAELNVHDNKPYTSFTPGEYSESSSRQD